ncbi:MAG: ankyrin repeat domain-containing protein, partial [Legionellaceae bacterium]|nr:ankyrin repeat domain-containing protein [Legionellaceae bacterium]
MQSTQETPKTAYSCYFEVQLDEKDFGLDREKHFKICNEQLLIQLHALENEGRQLHPDISNICLIEQISETKSKSPRLFTWEHCSSSTANGRYGVMRLVPKYQHTKTRGNEFCRIIHPDDNYRGGYHEWAVPAGAPASRTRLVKPVPHDINIQSIPKEKLHIYFKMAIRANRYDQLEQLLERAKIFTAAESEAIFTQQDPITKDTLLHYAAKNGYLPILNVILDNISNIYDFLHVQNHCGNTAAHIAADNNRYIILKKLNRIKNDFSIKNKKQQTAYDIATIRGFSVSQNYCQPTSYNHSSSSAQNDLGEKVHQKEFDGSKKVSDSKQARSKHGFRDPAFTYDDLSKNAHSQSSATSSEKKSSSSQYTPTANYTFKDLMREKFSKSAADNFIEAAEVSRKSQPKSSQSTPAKKYTFKDVMIEKFGEKRAAHFIEAGEVSRKSQPKSSQSTPGKKYTFKDVMIEKLGEKRAAHFIEAAEVSRKSQPKSFQPIPAKNHTFKDVMRDKFGERRASHFIEAAATNQQIQQVPEKMQQQTQQRSLQQSQQQTQQKSLQLSQQQSQQKSLQLSQQQSQQQTQQKSLQQSQQQSQQQTQQKSLQQSQQQSQQQTQQKSLQQSQ